MDILFTSFVVSKDRFKEVYEEARVKPGQQVQKLNSQTCKGFAKNGDRIVALSTAPVSRATSSKFYVRGGSDVEEGVEYRYIPFINFPIIKQFGVLVVGFFKALGWALKGKRSEKVILCDTLAPTLSTFSIAVSRLCGIKRVAFVTDIPYIMDVTTETYTGVKAIVKKLYGSVSAKSTTKYHGYVLLTEAMNDLINPKGRPHMIMEGMVDSNHIGSENRLEDKYDPPVLLYAGTLYRKYGVEALVYGFLKSKVNAKLWVFGWGEMEDELRELNETQDRMTFFGTVPNQEILDHEVKATLLVNPRPSTEDFTKYCFPSKNMEYMMSGTAVLATRIPSMPEDYHPNMFLLDDESPEGIAKTLEEILAMPVEEIHKRGQAGKAFVENQKTNTAQTARIKAFIQTLR